MNILGFLGFFGGVFWGVVVFCLFFRGGWGLNVSESHESCKYFFYCKRNIKHEDVEVLGLVMSFPQCDALQHILPCLVLEEKYASNVSSSSIY